MLKVKYLLPLLSSPDLLHRRNSDINDSTGNTVLDLIQTLQRNYKMFTLNVPWQEIMVCNVDMSG